MGDWGWICGRQLGGDLRLGCAGARRSERVELPVICVAVGALPAVVGAVAGHFSLN